MIKNYFKIWLVSIKKRSTVKSMALSFVEPLLYFLIIYLISNFNLLMSILVMLVLIMLKSTIRILTLAKELKKDDSYSLLLLRPIDSLFGLIVYDNNIFDILLIIPLLLYLKVKTKKT